MKHEDYNKHRLSEEFTKNRFRNFVLHSFRSHTPADYLIATQIANSLKFRFRDRLILWIYACVGNRNAYVNRVQSLVQPYLHDANMQWNSEEILTKDVDASLSLLKESCAEVQHLAQMIASTDEPAPKMHPPISKKPIDPRLLQMFERMEAIEPCCKHPVNFRQLLVRVGDRQIALGLMAHPWLYSASQASTGNFGIPLATHLRKLKAAPYHTLIALDERAAKTIQFLWQIDGFWHLEVMSENIPPDLEQFTRIYEVVKQSANAGKNIVLYCEEGFGRSGTIAASIVLRQLICETIGSNFTKNTPLFLKNGKSIMTTPLVANAIGIVRAAGDPPKMRLKEHNSLSCSRGCSVELEDQVHALEKLERALRGYES